MMDCIVWKDNSEILRISEKSSSSFEISYGKEVPNKFTYLGMKVELKENIFYIGQLEYTKKILNEFGFKHVSPGTTPIEPCMPTKEENFRKNDALDINMPYSQAVGSLRYLSISSSLPAW